MRLSRVLPRGLRLVALSACAAITGMATQIPTLTSSAASTATLVPGNLLVATSTYQNDQNIVAGSTQLPPGCFVAATLTSTLVNSTTYTSLAVSSLAQAIPSGYSLVISDNAATPTTQTLTASGSSAAGATTISVDSFTAKAAYAAGTATVTSDYDPCGTAVANGDYPYVFNNDSVDGSFGVTSPITLNQLTTSGTPVSTIEVPNSSESGITPSSDQMVTSFSSKSELALNLSTDGRYVTFMGYNAAADHADVSNANTPGDIDPTSADPDAYYRVVGELGENGSFHFTETNAFSGDNGRAAILNDEPGAGVFYAAGNGGNGASPEPPQVIDGTGAQLIQPSTLPEAQQTVPQPTAVGSFNVTQVGIAADKSGKDDNFRGETVYNNVLYFTKGSGSNGVDTVYFVDTTGKACPSGTGLPEPGASLPTSSDFTYNTSDATYGLTAKNPGLTPENMCILKGLPATSAKDASDATDYPFGMWFANPTTLYIADEGAGDNTYDAATNTYTNTAASTTAGLQKWSFNGTQWVHDYTLQTGLNLGVPYTVSGYPTGLNSGPGGTDLPWAPATAGLRNITGEVNPNGSVTIWAETSTVSGSGDQGADPNALVSITDNLAATGSTAPTNESFTTIVPPANGVVVRGVSFTPGTNASVSGNVNCTGSTYSGTTISGNVTVPSGSGCTLVDATVDGNVQVQNGGSLLDTASNIQGNLQTNSAASVDVDGGTVRGNLQVQQTTGSPAVGNASSANDLCGATVNGNVQVQNNAADAPFDIGSAPDCTTPLSVGGNLQVQNNAGTVTIGPAENGSGNAVQGNIQVNNNTGGGALADNSAGGNCQLQNDSPGIVGSSNTAKGNNSCNATA